MLTALIINLAFGGLAGWLAGRLMNSDGTWVRNIILGLLGGVVGSIVLGFVGIHGNGRIGSTLVSVVGACILIWISRKL